MAVQRVAVTTGAPAAATAFTPTLPTHAAGDRLVLVVTGKYNTTSIPTINQGWVVVQSGTGGTGSAANDTGQTFWAVYAKDATSGAETAPTVTPGGTAPNSWEWACFTYSHGSTGWLDAIANGAAWVTAASDSNTASPLTGTAGAWTGVEPTAGDAILAVGTIPTDLGSALGTTTLTCTGLSGGTKDTTSTNYRENALGQDSALVWADWVDFTGTASAGLAMSFTVTGATNQSGSLIAIALRAEPPDPNAAVLVSTSRSGSSDNNATSNTCPVPAGAAAGMTALLAIEIFLDSGSSPVTPTWPSGFTQIVDRQANPSNGVQLLVAKKTLTGADSGNYVTTFPSARWNQSDCVLIDKAVTVSTPDANSLKDGSGTNIGALTVDTTEAPVLVHFQANSSAATHTPPALFTERQEGEYITVATRTPGAGGTYGTSLASQSVSTVWAAVLLAAEGGVAGLPPQNFNDAAGATDALTAEQANTRTLTDTAGAADVVTVQQANTRTMADTAAATDALTALLSKDVGLADTAGGTDVLAVTMAALRAMADTAGVADAVSVLQANTRTVADTAAAMDALIAVLSTAVALSDAAGGTDALAATVAADRPLSDNAGGTDLVATVVQAARTLADTAGATDSLTTTKGASPNLADTAGATDALTITQVMGRGLADTAGATDSLTASKSGAGSVGLADNAAATDALATGADRPRVLADTAGATDALATTRGMAPTLADTAGATDSLQVQLVHAYQVGLADVAAASDVLQVLLEHAFNVGLDDTAAATDALTVIKTSKPLGVPVGGRPTMGVGPVRRPILVPADRPTLVINTGHGTLVITPNGR